MPKCRNMLFSIIFTHVITINTIQYDILAACYFTLFLCYAAIVDGNIIFCLYFHSKVQKYLHTFYATLFNFRHSPEMWGKRRACIVIISINMNDLHSRTSGSNVPKFKSIPSLIHLSTLSLQSTYHVECISKV